MYHDNFMSIVFRFGGLLIVSLFLFIAFAFVLINLFFDSPLLSEYLGWLLVAICMIIGGLSYLVNLYEQRDSEKQLNALIDGFRKDTLTH